MNDLTKRRGERVTVKPSTVRGITYLPHGQRCETWLPAGTWMIDGECHQTDRDGHMASALLVWRADRGTLEKWYVGIDAV